MKTVDKNILQQAVSMLDSNSAACIVIKDDKIIKSGKSRGIGELLSFYDEGILSGAFVADKIIGRAAAMIITAAGSAGCHGSLMSRGAAKYLKEHRIPFSYKTLTEKIINRSGDGICPMEEAVYDITDPFLGIDAVRNKIALLKSK